MKTLFKYEKFITRQMLKDNPDTLFVFGDNMIKQGYGGQAKEMRGEPNAVGIPTKWRPSKDASSYFLDSDYNPVAPEILKSFTQLFDHVLEGGKVVWPNDGVGTGLAQLPTRAPKIFHCIETHREILETICLVCGA